MLREANDWPGLNEHILLLAKRRSQLKQAVQAFVRQAMGYVDEAPDEAARVELIKTLQSVTEGKVNLTWSIPVANSNMPASGLVYQVSASWMHACAAATSRNAPPHHAQIYVEIERARLTKRLAKIKEAGGDVNEAADTLQEVAVVRALPAAVQCWPRAPLTSLVQSTIQSLC